MIYILIGILIMLIVCAVQLWGIRVNQVEAGKISVRCHNAMVNEIRKAAKVR